MVAQTRDRLHIDAEPPECQPVVRRMWDGGVGGRREGGGKGAPNPQEGLGDDQQGDGSGGVVRQVLGTPRSRVLCSPPAEWKRGRASCEGSQRCSHPHPSYAFVSGASWARRVNNVLSHD